MRMRNTDGAERGRWATFVATIRRAMSLDKTAFGRRIGVDRGTVHRWESGRFRPKSADDVARFAEGTGVDLHEALAAAGFIPSAPERPARPPLDPDLAWLAARLQDPTTSATERDLIRATVRHLARLADADDQRRAG